MSAFENLPREIRDQIYEYCLLYDGEIIPFPRAHEREFSKRRLQLEEDTKLRTKHIRRQKVVRNAFLGYPNVKREALQTENKPCVALLGVNSMIREEAARILFGQNVWRLSSRTYTKDDRYRLWETFATYFRHIVTTFDTRDTDETRVLDLLMEGWDRDEEGSGDSDHFDQAGSAAFRANQLSCLRDGFVTKRKVLQHMNLKTLSFDFSQLFNGCSFRHEALECCLECLESISPWNKLDHGPEGDSKNELETDIKVLGLKNEKEKELFWETWGLKVD